MKTRVQQTLGRYQIEAEIGRGAMGVVYRAHDPKIDRLVAIKTISLAGQEPEAEQEYRERFLLEARAAGCLSHPGIVTIFDAGEEPETHEPYLVMEYISGESLSRTLSANGGKLPVVDALRLVLEISEALNYAHTQGVIHRDIKPANILITDDGHAKIADFGVARLNHTLTTHTGQIFGSPAYMAPEQLMRGEADASSDLFSVGVMLYSMLTGFRPFQGNSAETVCFKVMNIEPVPVTSFQAALDPALDQIVSKAIAKNPSARYQSGAELAADLREVLQATLVMGESGQPLPSWAAQSAPSHMRGTKPIFKQFAIQVGLAVLAIAGLLTIWQVRKDMREVHELAPPAARVQSAPAIQKTPLAFFQRQNAKRKNQSVPKLPIQTARMHVEILHHFADAKASVMLDDKVFLDDALRGDDERHPILRSLEMDHNNSFEAPAGKHRVQVHVATLDGSYDQSEAVDAELPPGSRHLLVINCDKKKMQVSLREQPPAASSPRTPAPAASTEPIRAATVPPPAQP